MSALNSYSSFLSYWSERVVDYLDIARRVMQDRLSSTIPDGAIPAQSPEMDTDPPGIPWAEWKARELNRLFQERGVTGQPGQITAATILHGLRSEGGNSK